MTLEQKLCDAIREKLTDGKIQVLAERLVLNACSGDDLDTIRMVLGFATNSERAELARSPSTSDGEECPHYPGMRHGYPVMGGGPLKETCACGVEFRGGKLVEPEKEEPE